MGFSVAKILESLKKPLILAIEMKLFPFYMLMLSNISNTQCSHSLFICMLFGTLNFTKAITSLACGSSL